MGELGLDIRMIRSVPETGTFTGLGTVLGQPVNLASSVAYGRDGVGVSWFDLDIMHTAAHAPLSLWMEFDLAPPVGPGEYNVGAAAGQVEVEVNRGAIGDEDATGGTVTLTTINAGRAEGNYNLILPLGGSLMGSFAVDIIIRQ